MDGASRCAPSLATRCSRCFCRCPQGATSRGNGSEFRRRRSSRPAQRCGSRGSGYYDEEARCAPEQSPPSPSSAPCWAGQPCSIGKAAGWIDARHGDSDRGRAGRDGAALPLESEVRRGRGKPARDYRFDPAEIYAEAAAGVVTILRALRRARRDDRRDGRAGLRLRRHEARLHPHELARDHDRRRGGGTEDAEGRRDRVRRVPRRRARTREDRRLGSLRRRRAAEGRPGRPSRQPGSARRLQHVVVGASP